MRTRTLGNSGLGEAAIANTPVQGDRYPIVPGGRGRRIVHYIQKEQKE